MASETADLAPGITVDLETVEDDIGGAVEPELRRVIGHEGSTTSVALDKWGYASESTTPLFSAVQEHGRVIHPDRGPLDARYAPLRNMSATISVLRKLRGEDRNIGTVIAEGDDEEYIDGLADLYDSARALDERRDDWREDQHPTIAMGSYGPDQLGNLYVHVGHDDQSVVEGISVEDHRQDRALGGGR